MPPANLHAISSPTLHSCSSPAWSTTLPSSPAANQLSKVTASCKLRQHCYDSFCNQQLSSDGKSEQWARREKEKEGGLPQGEKEEHLGCSSSMPAGTDTSSDTNTFITPATHRWAQTKGNAKRMHSFDVCTRSSSNQLPVTVAAAVHSDVPLGVANSVTRH